MIMQLLSAGFLLCILIVRPGFGEYIPPGPTYRCPTNKILIYPCKCIADGDKGIKVECINTNLASMSIGLTNLASYKIPIEELTLNKCNIARLYGNVFHKLKIRILRITHTPIESLDEHLFHGTNVTLNELYIYNSSLTVFPKEAFKILGNLTLLQLDHHKIGALPNDAFTGGIVGVLQKFHMSNGKLSTLTIESITQLKKLKVLDLHGNNLTELKKNQFRGLRDTEVLDLSFNHLKKVDSSHLADLTKLSWCNVSNNNLAELTRGAFARNAVLRVLNMSFNQIKRLDTNSFRGMRFLRRLYLSDNMISDIGRGTFSSVTRIGTIDLARNQLKKVDYQMFYQLNYIEIIDVSDNNITIIEKLAFKDLYLTHINLSRNAIEKIETKAFENCVNISVLDLSHNQLKTVQKKAFDEISYADQLQLSFNYFTDLSQVPLQNMSGLRILNVSHNEIEIIPKNTFPKLYELHTIDLSYNNLTEIWNGVFQTLFSLRHLNLSHNSLSIIKPSTFGTLPTLLSCDLSYNQLKDIAKGAFAKFSSARTLSFHHNQIESIFQLPISVGAVDFSYNQLERIPEKTWPSMNSVLELNFRGNKFGNNLIHGSFSPLLTLRVLDLSENGMSEVPFQALGDLTSLQYLYLERNNLTELKKGAFGRLPVVFELNMAHNQIKEVSVRAFEGLLQLLTLNLTDNQISYVPNGAFQGLVSLQTLDLSFNRLEKLDNKTHGLLEDCLSLERLNLSHNKMSFITRKTFPSSPWIPYKLRDLDLSYNVMPIITYDLVFGTGRVEKLNLSHNMVTEIRPGVIGNMTRLKILDLSNNEIEDLITLGTEVKKEEKLLTDKGIFYLPPNITEIYLQNNFLPRLPLNNIKNCSKLEILNVAHNKLISFENELVTMVKADTKVFYDGNPLTCDCFLRPIKKLMDQQMNMREIYRNLKCGTPLHLADQNLLKIPDDRLTCVDNIENRLKMSQNDMYEVTSDLKFRDVKFSRDKIIIRWLVNNIIDIADFYILIRTNSQESTSTKILFETNVPYWTRLFEMNVDDIEPIKKAIETNTGELQLCVLARNSKYFIRKYFKNQCTMFPENLHFNSGGRLLPHSLILGVMLLIFKFM